MSADELNALSDDGIDRLIAERVMGWRANHIDQPPTHHSFYWWDAAGIEPVMTKDKWCPSSNHNDCAAMRAEIERWGKTWVFCFCLREIIKPIAEQLSLPPTKRLPASWFLIQSTPRQQCIAALLTMEEKS